MSTNQQFRVMPNPELDKHNYPDRQSLETLFNKMYSQGYIFVREVAGKLLFEKLKSTKPALDVLSVNISQESVLIKLMEELQKKEQNWRYSELKVAPYEWERLQEVYATLRKRKENRS
jgi:hypothetical protein